MTVSASMVTISTIIIGLSSLLLISEASHTPEERLAGENPQRPSVSKMRLRILYGTRPHLRGYRIPHDLKRNADG